MSYGNARAASVIGLAGALLIAINMAQAAAPEPAKCDNNVLKNGDFETGPKVGKAGFIEVKKGSTDINDWLIGSGSVDYVGPYWQAASGNFSIDVNGLGPGLIYQKVTVTRLDKYTLTFYLSGNPAGGPAEKTVAVRTCPLGFSECSNETSFTYNTATEGNSIPNNMLWRQETWTFNVGTVSSLSIVFDSKTEGAYGPAIDNACLINDDEISKP